MTPVAEHSVPVSVQHVATEQVPLSAPAHAGVPVLSLYADGHEYCPLTAGANTRRAKARMTKAIALTKAGECKQG